MKICGVKCQPWLIVNFLCGTFCRPQLFYDHQNIMGWGAEFGGMGSSPEGKSTNNVGGLASSTHSLAPHRLAVSLYGFQRTFPDSV